MKVYILKWQEQDINTMVIVAANTREEVLDVLRHNDRAFLYFDFHEVHLKRVERSAWRFDDEHWCIKECPALTANVDEPQIIDEV